MSRRRTFAFAAIVFVFVFAFAAVAAIAPREIHKTLPLSADGKVEIHAFKGSITVTGGSTNEVDVTARIEPDGDDGEQERAVRDTDVKVEGVGNGVRIES